MQNDKRNAMNEYVQRIENFFLLCMCSAQHKEERQFLASEKKLQRVLVNVPGDVAKDGIDVRMRMRVRVSGSP